MRTDSAYESWVLALRAWARDPQVSLSGLPALAEDDYPATVFDRLITHIQTALETVNEAWLARLQAEIAEARSDFELAQTLVASRRHLARRMELADHPGLPSPLRAVLSDACTRDVRRLQDELETAFRQARAQSPADASLWDRHLEVLRTNPLTGILPAATPGPPPPPSAPAPAATASRWGHRRIIPG
ncbi:MAG TPA: hypothetical protein PKE40_01200 [Arachnia sp.]|nr:hypothetical protein [Arachnia sp.]HMT84944.1 hypothetical protein [Arachnia sp.]